MHDWSHDMNANPEIYCLRSLRHAAAELLALIEAEDPSQASTGDSEKARLISQFIHDADERLQLK
jgi:hypothetical protein